MSRAEDLFHRLVEVGATVEAANGRLVVRAGARPVPGELVQRLREAKAEILATLAPSWWRRRYVIRTIDRKLGGARSDDGAARLAWAELECRWHRLYGERTPDWQCAGCGDPIGTAPSLDLLDGNRVHLDDLHRLDCIITYGTRWRGAAVAGLQALGLDPPAGFGL